MKIDSMAALIGPAIPSCGLTHAPQKDAGAYVGSCTSVWAECTSRLGNALRSGSSLAHQSIGCDMVHTAYLATSTWLIVIIDPGHNLMQYDTAWQQLHSPVRLHRTERKTCVV
jgi:hypothetical protein